MTISVQLNSHQNNTIPIGQVCKFTITRSDPRIQTRAFIIYQHIHYLKPLNEWNTNDCLNYFPEAPGEYALTLQWLCPGKEGGWVYFNFRVLADTVYKSGPVQQKLNRNTHLWGANEWEVKQFKGYEDSVFDLLKKIVKPGYVIYDIGASLGLYSIWFSEAVGFQGRVYCFEANPVCVYLLQANLNLNKRSNCEIFPVALSSGAEAIDFTINYGNSALGMARDSPLYTPKTGHEIIVLSHSLDELVRTFEFRKPDLIKIDVEGAEESIIKGMENTLIQHQPKLLLEVHGQTAADASFQSLYKLDYSFLHIESNRLFNKLDKLLEWFQGNVEQFLCFPSGKDTS